jgi:hypothetical protein
MLAGSIGNTTSRSPLGSNLPPVETVSGERRHFLILPHSFGTGGRFKLDNVVAISHQFWMSAQPREHGTGDLQQT